MTRTLNVIRFPVPPHLIEVSIVRKVTTYRFLFLCVASVARLVCGASLTGEEYSPPAAEISFDDLPKSWVEITGDQRIAPLELLVLSVESNSSALSTYRSRFLIDSKTATDNATMAMLGCDDHFSKKPNLISRLSMELVSDFRENKTFRNGRYLDSRYEYEGREIDLDNVGQLDCISIETPSEFIYKQNEMKFPVSTGIPELPDYPDFPLDQLVRIEPKEWNRFKSMPQGLNLREFYNLERWGNLRFVRGVMEGKQGQEEQTRINGIVHVYETVDEAGARWYRYQCDLENGGLDENLFWSETSGFMPVYDILTENTGAARQIRYVNWQSVNNVYVPVESYSIRFLSNGEFDHSRKTSISDIEVNEPIDSSVFTYESLGLAEGAMIVDNIQKKIYRYEKGEPVFFSEFNAKWKEKEKRNIDKFRLFVLVAGFAMIGAGIWLRRGRRGTTT